MCREPETRGEVWGGESDLLREGDVAVVGAAIEDAGADCSGARGDG